MWTLVITLVIGSFTIETDSITACQTAGFNLIHHDAALQGGGTDSHFFCVNNNTGEIWTNVEIPQN